MELYQLTIDREDPTTLDFVADMYIRGDGVIKDLQKAEELLARCGNQYVLFFSFPFLFLTSYDRKGSFKVPHSCTILQRRKLFPKGHREGHFLL